MSEARTLAPAPVTTPPSGPAPAPGRGFTVPAWAGGLVGVVVIVGVWWLASATLWQASGSVPSPTSVLALFLNGDEWQTLWNNAKGTIGAALWGALWGNLAAVVLATAVLLIPVLEGVVTQIAITTYCIPLVAIGPILVIVAGRDAPQGASIVLAALSVFFTTVVGCLLGFRAAPRASMDLVRAYGGSRWAQLRKVQIVSALPNLFAALKISAPAAFLGAVLAEYLGSGGDSSLGRALIAAQTQSDAPRLWYLAIASGLIAGAGYAAVGLVGRFVTPWSGGSTSRSGS
ncbi:ABC transporter permease subunit [Nakamurella flavida]|uniref:ABC transporter permease subunit n=1 Tax=Nakamurella flavida TaxID=363630 RepID=A0A938YM95_9ACTN|nr:ABC transporter permease subunit [Nakamurella flavida]MBM9477819.1 ABC transporter permease subunit [Nakamurella flavida]MDP9779373.1 ABC-type nitrate/sulfonate/bicarbonate transport system permease component [Nakamurella flavida]